MNPSPDRLPTTGSTTEAQVDDQLRASGRRVAAPAHVAAGDLDDLLRRSRTRRQHQSLAAVTVLVVALLLIGFGAVRRNTTTTDVYLGGDGRSATTSAPAPTTLPPPRPPGSAPSPVDLAPTPPPPCNSAAFASRITKLAGQPVTRVHRFACLRDWAAARVETQAGGPATYAFVASNSEWIFVSTNAENEIDKLKKLGMPIEGLYQIMGMRLEHGDPASPPTIRPGISIVEPDPTTPGVGVLEAVTRRFITDIGASSIQEGGGTKIKIYDGYLLSPTTARRMSGDERQGIEAALSEAGFAVTFVDVTGFTVSYDEVVPDATDPALLFADPSVEPNGPTATPEPGSFSVYAQISGCGRACGYGATYAATASGTDGTWVATPITK